MRLFCKTAKIFAALSFVTCSLIWAMIVTGNNQTADEYFVGEGQSLAVSDFVETVPSNYSVPSSTGKGRNSIQTELRLFGIFPIKTVNVRATEEICVVPGGIPFGIKMISDGVMVTAVSGINCNGKIISPARECGIKTADVIVRINGEVMRSNADVVAAVSKSGGREVKVTLRRESGKTEQIQIQPVLDPSDQCYKIGVWVRDSSAGIGTVTFYDPQTGFFGGLGHAVCDSDTGSPLALLQGEIVSAEIDGVTKGKNGAPGRLNGHFTSFSEAGKILRNDDTGVYGTLSRVKVMSQAIPVAFKQNVKTGKATILTTISGSSPKEYEIEIEKICFSNERMTKNMVIRVTDERLLSEAGGIVQGMSGSPIIQDGNLVGAVTHVFVNDSTRGYAIFAENMLSVSQQLNERAAS